VRCPTSARNLGFGITPIEKLLAAGVIVALGSDTQVQSICSRMRGCSKYELRMRRGSVPRSRRRGHAALSRRDVCRRAQPWCDGRCARSRPARGFFHRDLFDPSIAGAEPGRC